MIETDSVGVHSSFKETSNKVYVTSQIAILFAIHIALLQQMSGVNAIVVYGK